MFISEREILVKGKTTLAAEMERRSFSKKEGSEDRRRDGGGGGAAITHSNQGRKKNFCPLCRVIPKFYIKYMEHLKGGPQAV